MTSTLSAALLCELDGTVGPPFSPRPATTSFPVGVQLAWRLRALIASGRLRPGRADARACATIAELGGGQRQHRPRGLRAARGRRPDRHPPRPRQLRRRRRRWLARGRADRRRGDRRRPRRRGRPPRRRDRGARRGRPARCSRDDLPPSRETPTLDLAGAGRSSSSSTDAWLDARRGPAARRELRRQIGRLEAELAAYTARVLPRPRRCSTRRAADRRGRRTRRPPATPCSRARRCALGGGGPRPRASAARARCATRSSTIRRRIAGRWSRRPRRASRAAPAWQCRAAHGSARRADELVAGRGLGRLPVT